MKSKNLIVVFSFGVYLTGNSNAPITVHLLHLLFEFSRRSSFYIKNKLKSEIFRYKKVTLVTFSFIVGVH